MADLQSTLAGLLGGHKSIAHPLRLVRKHGRPFMLLPANGILAARTLALYPAQSFPARLAKRVLRGALSLGFPCGAERISLAISALNPFVRFLSNCAHSSGDTMARFGILAGNPNAPGQRFIFLLFDPGGNPAAVVKAGTTDEAKILIRREKDFLRSAPAMPGIPRVKEIFESPAVEALAMDFIDGESPRKNDERKLPELLASWITPAGIIPLRQTRVWKELQQRGGTLPYIGELARELNGKTASTVLFHGDLAPWNIKVSSDGNWTVFDWERGDLRGLPGYDWFHYFIQTRILVAQESTPVLLEELRRLLASPEFARYAALTGIAGIERQLLIMYLAHHNEVIQPGEGLDAGRELLRALMTQHGKR